MIVGKVVNFRNRHWGATRKQQVEGGDEGHCCRFDRTKGSAEPSVDVTFKYRHTTKHEKYKTMPKNASGEWRIYEIFMSNEFWNPIRPLDTTLTSNGRSAFMSTPICPIWVILDLMESLTCRLWNASCPVSKFFPSQRGSSKQGSVVAETKLGPWGL